MLARTTRIVFVKRERSSLIVRVRTGAASVPLDGDHDVAFSERGNIGRIRRRYRLRCLHHGHDTEEKNGFLQHFWPP
jgi:hypothetical protein